MADVGNLVMNLAGQFKLSFIITEVDNLDSYFKGLLYIFFIMVEMGNFL